MNKKSLLIGLAIAALFIAMSSSVISQPVLSAYNFVDANLSYRQLTGNTVGIYINTIDRNGLQKDSLGKDINFKWGFDTEDVEIAYKHAVQDFFFTSGFDANLDACKGELVFVTDLSPVEQCTRTCVAWDVNMHPDANLAVYCTSRPETCWQEESYEILVEKENVKLQPNYDYNQTTDTCIGAFDASSCYILLDDVNTLQFCDVGLKAGDCIWTKAIYNGTDTPLYSNRFVPVSSLASCAIEPGATGRFQVVSDIVAGSSVKFDINAYVRRAGTTEMVFGIDPSWTSTATADFEEEGYDLNFTKVTGDNNVMPSGELRVPDRDLPQGHLVGYWKLDSNNGAVAIDRSGLGNNGTWTNGADTNGDGWFFDSNSGFFDGVDDHITMGDPDIAEGVPALTVTAWVKTGINDTAITRAIVAQAGAVTDTFELSWLSNDNLGFSVWNSDGTIKTDTIGDGLLNEQGKWHFVTGRYNGAEVEVFLDGVGSGSPTAQDSATGTTSNPLRIGSTASNSAWIWTGEIAEVKIFSRSLSNEEIVNMYNRNLDGNGLVAYYTFNDTNSNDTGVEDLAGNDDNGHLVSGADTNGLGLWDTNAFFGDGVDNHVNTSIILPGGSDPFSVTGWFKTNNTGQNQEIISQWNHLDTVLFRFNLNNLNGNAVTFRVREASPAQNVDVVTGTLNNGQWYHLAGTYDGSDAAFYLDGVLLGSNTTGALDGSQADNFIIGRYITGTNPVNGLIEEVKLYDRGLTHAEVIADYNSWMQGKYYSPVEDANGVASLKFVRWQETSDQNNSLTVEVRGCEDKDCAIAGDWFPVPEASGGQEEHSLGSLDGNQFVEYVVNFDTNKDHWNPFRKPAMADKDRGAYAKISDVNVFYNMLPDANIWTIDGYDQRAMPSFSTGADGNLTFDFNVSDLDNFDAKTADINYSTTNTQGSGTNIGKDIAMDGNWCVTNFTSGFDGNHSAYGQHYDANLVGYWNFNGVDANQDRVFDYSGQGNHGHNLNGADNNIAGKWDTNAFFGDMVDNVVWVGDNDIFSFGDSSNDRPFSVSYWFYFTTASVGEFTELVSKRSGTTLREWYSLKQSDEILQFAILDESVAGSNTKQRKSSVLSANTWYHVVATYDGTSTIAGLNLYINGVLDNDASVDGGSYVAMENLSSPVTIGNHGTSSFPLGGFIEEVKIYGRELTNDEVSADYNAGYINKRKCSWDWDITGIADNNYYANILIKDSLGGGNEVFDASDNSFQVNPVADSCSCPASGVWNIISGDDCTLSALCNLADSLNISNGRLTVAASGILNLLNSFQIIIDQANGELILQGGEIQIEK